MTPCTPGPWEIVKDHDQWRLRQKGSFKRRPGFTIERPVAEGFIHKLDAQLAAAAPDLLEALESFPGFACGTHAGDAWIEQMRAAMARARGAK